MKPFKAIIPVQLSEMDYPIELRPLVRGFNVALQAQVARENEALGSISQGLVNCGLWSRGQIITVRFDATDESIDKERAFTHTLGVVPAYYVLVGKKIRNPIQYMGRLYCGAYNARIEPGKTDWTTTQVYFYPNEDTLAWKVEHYVLLVPGGD